MSDHDLNVIMVESDPQNQENAVAELPRVLSSDPQTVKHSFVHMCLDPSWVEYPMMLDVNTCLMVSIDGGPWHGKAVYVENNGLAKWTLLYHYKGDMNKLKQVEFKQVKKSNAYLALGPNPSYNCLLIEQRIQSLNTNA